MLQPEFLERGEDVKHPFFGGVHPDDGKGLSAGLGPDVGFQPKTVAILMQQHIGAPCTPLVQVGDLVKRGQKVGDGEGLCVPVHASVSGRVIAVEPRKHPGGNLVPAVVIENDLQNTDGSALIPHPDYETLDPEDLRAIIREAGIVGHGGAAFPTERKTQTGQIDTLIANACECEPYITADDSLLRRQAEQVFAGMEIVAQILNPQRLVLAVEDNKQEAIRGLGSRIATPRTNREIALHVLPTRYPQGAEKQLIQAITGQEVPSGKLPSVTGCAVFNAATFAAVYRAVCAGEPVTRRIVSVTGEGVQNPNNILCPIGTSYRELIDYCGGLRRETEKVLCGGPMMGFAQNDLSVVTIKGTNAILCLTDEETRENPVCIRCGRCVAVCPMRLQPLYLYRYQQTADAEQLRRFHVFDCIGCGCCSYTCPGKLPLAEAARRGKVCAREGMVP